MSNVKLPAIVGLLLILAPDHAFAGSLHLLCAGDGSARGVAEDVATATDYRGHFASVQSFSPTTTSFADQVDVELIDGGTGRIRMPRALLPRIHGGKDGWFEIKEVVAGDSDFTGTILVSAVAHPKLRIDRRTGHLSISGKDGDFGGACQLYDPATLQRKF